ncbi:3'-5' exonuclease [Serratia marcescens]|uniref:3'-5' exonuclease n=1 Tax=Serratia marcescens TaxID=615 RepID=UPI003D778B83
MSVEHEGFISVDIETAGPIPGVCSLLSIGACVIDRPAERFYIEVQPLNLHYEPEALAVTGFNLQTQITRGINPKEAMQQFAHWVTAVTDAAHQPVFVGFNAAFDWSFINYYFHVYLGHNPFGFAALDIKALYMGATGCDWQDTRSSRIDARFNLKNHGSHNALDDALYQAEMFLKIKAHMREKR